MGQCLATQQKCDNDFIINVVDGVCFPKFPVGNFMQNNDVANLSQEQDIKLKGLQLSYGDINKFEEKTRLQSQSPLWFRIREHRITASNIGRVYKRRKDDEKLAKQLKSTRRVVTAAMKRGVACEPQAAKRYAEVCENRVNLYPCGVVVSFWAPWLAASPDRKVYDPTRNPPFGLLEIKCPQVTSVLEAACLKKDVTGQLALNRNHDYYYQVLAQLACTGLEWCDFFVWTENDHHMEAVYFNQDVWNTVKNKVDKFYFNHFI
ncbi:uncharacterized protein LOC128558057 [Mercenaria mercenaria]|uniref:uncharacterized protein LOC128558057 n=1 Tax=Mercenaria mercenaria TaxID=6596 RepID=UPI00234F3E9C|nr:uncharacterized protein LOC128558057 [Mercenaria mercenaria]